MSIYFKDTFQRSFGTYPLEGEELINSMQIAYNTGYRSFDTAQMYGNESDVGQAIKTLGLARDELCITTKVHPDNFSEEMFIPSVKQSLLDLQMDEVDVLLLHWPPIGGDIKPSLLLLQEAHKQGLTKNIGVSNYNSAMLREAVDLLDVPLVTNQVEFHPLLNQDVLLATSAEVGVPLSSFCSVARGEIFKHKEFAEIGEHYNKSAAQVALRWILQKGVSINTMSTKEKNIKANFDLMDFTLSNVDMARIEEKTKTDYRICHIDLCPWAPEWD